MTYNYSKTLNPQKALIWRIVHRENIPWILDNGLYCGNSNTQSSNWVHIGNTELIDKRASHPVPVAPNGVLNDYVPFYFTPFSVMMKNIHSGRGVQQRFNKDIVILVSSLRKIDLSGIPFIFTDSHAYYSWAKFYTDLADLNKIDWSILQERDFKRDADDPAKFERYQAEALIHQHCPISELLGMFCYNEPVQLELNELLSQRGLQLDVHARSGWYF